MRFDQSNNQEPLGGALDLLTEDANSWAREHLFSAVESVADGGFDPAILKSSYMGEVSFPAGDPDSASVTRFLFRLPGRGDPGMQSAFFEMTDFLADHGVVFSAVVSGSEPDNHEEEPTILTTGRSRPDHHLIDHQEDSVKGPGSCSFCLGDALELDFLRPFPMSAGDGPGLASLAKDRPSTPESYFGQSDDPCAIAIVAGITRKAMAEQVTPDPGAHRCRVRM
ncbi:MULTISPECIES: hypothetical protein [unclassified Thioalkalivibrio]|uniref:hypothetical protein n=1 Tax=unclassified Thioalkalivibrio TaxID=2621013 RepID=UPI000380DA84|nr:MULTISPECIES: hypothetical protein [unclassified Thioalkalivibrio]